MLKKKTIKYFLIKKVSVNGITQKTANHLLQQEAKLNKLYINQMKLDKLTAQTNQAINVLSLKNSLIKTIKS